MVLFLYMVGFGGGMVRLEVVEVVGVVLEDYGICYNVGSYFYDLWFWRWCGLVEVGDVEG